MKQTEIFILLVLTFLSPQLLGQEELEGSVKDYYFQLEDFVEPKVYFYENTRDPENGFYWRISSLPDSNILLTEAFLLDFEQFESFKEHYDSIGSKVIEYISIEHSDSALFTVEESEVVRWNSTEECKQAIRAIGGATYEGYDKTRQYQARNTMEILGKSMEVVRFKDQYTFYFDGMEYEIRQQAFYSKEYGLVRYVRFHEILSESETYILTKIYSEEEWIELKK